MFRFESTQYFLLLWLLPVLAIVVFFLRRKIKNKLKQSLGQRAFPFLTSSVSPLKRRIKMGLQALCLVFLVIALARPQSGQGQQKVKSQGVEIMLALDVSESMLAEDVKPNRLEQAKAEINRFVDMMPGNKIGVIAFAGTAALLSPMTNDPGAVKMYVDSMQTNSVSSQGTNFLNMLVAAKEAFDRGGLGNQETVKVSRVILVISDGEDHEQGALDYAKTTLAKEGIRIFTMAYGTSKGGTIPVRDNMGFLRGYKKDENGQVINSTVNGDALKALADAGRGGFYFAVFGGDHIKKLMRDLEKLERAEFDSSVVTQYNENFQWPLLMGILIGILELFLGERRSAFRFWKGRFEVPST